MQKAKSIKLMGTVIDLLIDSKNPDQHLKLAEDLLYLYNQRFSDHDESSELMAINHQAGEKEVKVHPELFELIQLGKKHSLEYPSNFNIAIGPLVNQWRIGFDDATVPNEEEIQKAVSLSNPKNILLDEQKQTVFLTQKGMNIDLGAVAKGYIADRIIDRLKQEDVSSALINLGGNVLVYGKNPKREDGSWRIGIQNPKTQRGNHVGILDIKDQSVVTSGIYERYLKVGSKIYHHIFDRNTGYPIETEMASLTIVSDLSVDGEIWTTRLFGLPLLEAVMTIQQTPHIEGIIITTDNRLVVSDGLKEHFTLIQP